MRFRLLLLTEIDLYVFVGLKGFGLEKHVLSKSLLSNQPMRNRVTTFLENTSRFGNHMRLPVLWLTELDLYVLVGLRGFGLGSIFLFR